MKRVRGVDEVTPPSSSSSAAGALAPPTAAVVSTATVTLNRGPAGGAVVVSGAPPPPGVGGNSGSAAANLISIGAGSGSIEYHSVSSIGVVSGQTVRTVPPKDMPSSIQFSQTQQQYPGAIVVPTAAASTIKGASLVGLSNNPASSMASTVTLHSAPGMGGPGNHSMGHQAPAQVQSHAQQPSAIRHKQIVQANTPPISNMTSSGGGNAGIGGGGNGPNSQQFQRLKVEDALSYLDQVKYKFSDQPQVYNDFLDIMKEFKSQSIDTPGVITRVSHLFKDHPELIVGFNTFLPPGYKIEVQSSDQGYALQVSVSMPSPTATHTATHTATISQHHCSINIGSPPIASSPSQPTKAQPVVQILQNTGSIHHSIANNISNNNMTLHGPVSPPVSYNNSHVTQAQAQAVSQALSQAQDGTPSTGQTQQSQPVEFNHAINYVNKIKNRFQGQPDKYKRFLEILHTYQKEQRTLKESGHMGGSGSGGSGPAGGKHLTEQEVYTQVAKLFENQEDLLMEFGQFLPDATGNSLSAMFQSNKVGGPVNDHATIVKKPLGMKTTYNNTGSMPREHRDSTGPGGIDRDSRDHRDRDRERERASVRDIGNAGQKFGHSQGQLKRSPSFTTSMATGNSHVSHGPPPPKKHKVASARDMSIAEVGKHGTLADYAFFDKVRKALRSPEVYENFLRCLVLFNHEIVSKTELVLMVSPFLGRFPELLRWFKDFLGYTPESAQSSSSASCQVQGGNNSSIASIGIEALPNNVVRSHQDRPQGDLAMEIDYSTCKRLGASYCALPKTYMQPRCSGRTSLCKEVLNDTWVSFPTWSEDSTFVTSRKTQFEEFIYRCEDERFELDGVIETNAATIRVLDGVHKKMNRMSPDELQKYKLDNKLGGSSETIHQRALRRIYGEKAVDIIDGLKKNPVVAVPVVLRRLKSKEEEWREAQKGFNKIWREQNEKYYLKSLDHQGINFKQNDVKALRSKSLFSEIEQLYDERHEQADESNENQNSSGPHLILNYKDKKILDDAANLLIHHVKRQTAIHKEDKQKIKQLLKHFIPDLFFHPRQELSDDEQDDDDDKDEVNTSSCSNNTQTGTTMTASAGSGLQGSKSKTPSSPSPASYSVKIDPDVKPPSHALSNDPDEAYTLFMASNSWYLFLRLHHILCERLSRMHDRAVILAQEESQYKQQRKESTSVALRLKPKNEVEVEDYYPAFLDMVKNVLDGNMESNSYEDTLREMFGIHAYIAFTLDKVVTNAVRQLQHLVSDPTCHISTDLYQRELRQPKESTGAGGLCTTAYLRVASEMAYQRKAEKSLTDENCFKVCIYKKSAKMTIELLDTEGDENTDSNSRDRDRESVSTTEKWSSYVERYSAAGQSSPKDVPTSSDNEPAANHPVSSDQAAKGGRGRKRKNTETNKKIDGNNGWSSYDKVLPGRKRGYLHRNVYKYKKEAARKLKANCSPNAASAATANTEKSSGQDSKKPYDSSNSIAETIADVVAAASASSDTMTREGMQCTFNLNSYRAVFVVNQESIMYKKGCLTRAKQSHPKVTKSMGTKFQQWHFKWVNKNVVDAQHRLCQDWLMGRYENLIPHRTRVITDNDLQRTPYRPYNRFTIDRLDQQSQQQQAEQMRSSDK